MRIRTAQELRALGCVVVLSCSSLVASAHVLLDSPNGGESFSGGSTATIEWHIDIPHNTENWDLWYSTVSNDGPWEEITSDFPVGENVEDAALMYDWIVPSLSAANAWVRVRQDNRGDDYYDVSDASFRITAALGGGDFTGDGRVDSEDLSVWKDGYGTNATASPNDGDADLDGNVDGADFLTWQNDAATNSVQSNLSAVPEPSSAVLVLLGLLGLPLPSRS